MLKKENAMLSILDFPPSSLFSGLFTKHVEDSAALRAISTPLVKDRTLPHKVIWCLIIESVVNIAELSTTLTVVLLVSQLKFALNAQKNSISNLQC
jgi:hypothetical protein